MVSKFFAKITKVKPCSSLLLFMLSWSNPLALQASTCQKLFKQSSNVFKFKEEDLLENKFSYDQLLSKLTDNITIDSVNKELLNLGSSTKIIKKLIQFIESIEKLNNKNGEFVSQFYLELKILNYIYENFWNLKSENASDFVLERASESNFLPKETLRTIYLNILDLNKLSPSALIASKLEPKDLFLKNTPDKVRRVDGLTISTRVKILRWLEGRYSEVSTIQQLKSIINQYPELNAKYDSKFGWKTCTIYNPWAQEKLISEGLFLVREILPGRNAFQTQHTFLKFYPANGKDPFIIDFSFKQFINEPEFSNGIFIGTEQNLLNKLTQYNTKESLFYFDTSEGDRLSYDQGVSSKSIAKLKIELENLKKLNK